MLGSSIISVKRQVFESDMDLDDFEQSADGPIQIELVNGEVLSFVADTKLNSIGVVKGNMPEYGESYLFMDLTSSDFWRQRVGVYICSVFILKSIFYSKENPEEFGILIVFKNGLSACIEFVSEGDFSDTIRVVKECPNINFEKEKI